jgi:hypothetical protein
MRSNHLVRCTGVVSVLAMLVFAAVVEARPGSISQSNADPATDPPQMGPELLAMAPEEIEAAYEGQEIPEAIRMYLVIVRGGQLDGRGGWFGPAESRFSWEWLAARHGVQPEESIKDEQFDGPPTIFKVLDRDRNKALDKADFDWASNNPWVQQSNMVGRIFRRMDPSGDGRMTSDEWQAFFVRVAGGQETIRIEQLRDAWIGGQTGGFAPGDEPSKDTLIKGLFGSELGSLQEGPDVDAPAPLFELKPLSGGGPVRLADMIGTKPIVLCFGNFTCGPFRSIYPAVEAVQERHPESAHFLLIYVREAHPTDGWAMSSNEKAGVSVAQPTTYDERVAVAGQCAAKLNPRMPLLVDDIGDPVGNAYSGMPARLYVIDREGRVAYKSGRGPFGFKPEEMEQALAMLLLSESGDSR